MYKIFFRSTIYEIYPWIYNNCNSQSSDYKIKLEGLTCNHNELFRNLNKQKKNLFFLWLWQLKTHIGKQGRSFPVYPRLMIYINQISNIFDPLGKSQINFSLVCFKIIQGNFRKLEKNQDILWRNNNTKPVLDFKKLKILKSTFLCLLVTCLAIRFSFVWGLVWTTT